MSHSHVEAQSVQPMPKILYVEDELTTNIPRLFQLFDQYLGPEERQRLEELEGDLAGFGASPEDIQQIFENVAFIDIEYRFPNALAKVLQCPEQYTLFIIDRNLANAEYTVAEVQKIDPQYSQEDCDRFAQREGDYLLVKLVTSAKISVLDKFYFLTAFSGHDEIRGTQAIKDHIDLVAFQHKNFIEKGNTSEIQLLRDAITNSPFHQPEFYEQIQASLSINTYLFHMKDGSKLHGQFTSPALRIQTKNAKTSLNTSQIRRITREGTHTNADFRVELKTDDVFQGRILDKKIVIETQVNPKYQVIAQNIHSVELI
jgi:hypothetical protein